MRRMCDGTDVTCPSMPGWVASQDVATDNYEVGGGRQGNCTSADQAQLTNTCQQFYVYKIKITFGQFVTTGS